MSAIIYLVGMIFSWSLFQPGSAKTDLPQMNDAELENFIQVEGSFQCEGTSCQCCVNVGIDFVSASQKACINVKYLSKNIGIFLNISLQGKEVYSEEVSVRNPPPICPTNRLLKKIGELCLELYNMTFSEENLAGCARISLTVSKLTKKTQLGCFGTSLNEDSNIDSIDENERNRETDISSNQNARMGGNNGNKHGREMEIYGLSLMFLFLINQ